MNFSLYLLFLSTSSRATSVSDVLDQLQRSEKPFSQVAGQYAADHPELVAHIEKDYNRDFNNVEAINLQLVRKLLEMDLPNDPTREKYLPLPPQFVFQILGLALEEFKKQPSLKNEISMPENARMVIVGDVHASMITLQYILDEERGNFPSEDVKILFNGDMVDRGPYSVETIITLLTLKIAYPDKVFLNRGNHETPMYNWDFKKDVYRLYGSVQSALGWEVFDKAVEVMNSLPLYSVVADTFFVAHGGLSSKADDAKVYNRSMAAVQDLNFRAPMKFEDKRLSGDTIDKKQFTTLSETQKDELEAIGLLWSDPAPDNEFKRISTTLTFNTDRNSGYLFAKQNTGEFLGESNLKMIVRSHEKVAGGVKKFHCDLKGQNCLGITVHSTLEYSGYTNKGEYVITDSSEDAAYLIIKSSSYPEAGLELLHDGVDGFLIYKDMVNQ